MSNKELPDWPDVSPAGLRKMAEIAAPNDGAVFRAAADEIERLSARAETSTPPAGGRVELLRHAAALIEAYVDSAVPASLRALADQLASPVPPSGDASSLKKPLQLAAEALRDLIAAGQMAKDCLDSDIPTGEPVHPVSRRLTWPLSTALLAEKEALAALAAQPLEQRPVAYLDIGAGGYVDLGSDLTPEQLQAMPHGRHALAIVGTFGIDGYVATQPEPAAQDKEAAVLSAAREWSAERMPSDWCEADLMRAIIVMEGDWPGCDECDHQCGEPCMPATTEEMLARVDSHIADLVHSGELGAYIGYTPPAGWKPSKRAARAAPTAQEASKPVQAEAPSPWATGLGLAVIGRKHFGNPIPQEWYAAARELLAAHSPASGAVEREAFETWMDSDAPPYWRTTAHARDAWRIWQARAALATQPLEQKPVAWCELTAAGSIAYFDGKPMVMCGPVGNEHHPRALYLGQKSVQDSNQLRCDGCGKTIAEHDPLLHCRPAQAAQERS